MAVLVAFITTSPLSHRLALSRYHAIHFIALSIAIVSAILGVLRPASRLTVTRAAVLLITFTEFAVFLSPEVPVRWANAQAVYACGFASVALLHAGFLVRSWIRVRWPRKGLVVALDTAEDAVGAPATPDGRGALPGSEGPDAQSRRSAPPGPPGPECARLSLPNHPGSRGDE